MASQRRSARTGWLPLGKLQHDDMKRTTQLAHIRQLCCIGISGQALMPTLLRAIREYASADSAGFFWVDARGEMTNLYADRMLSPGLMRIYFERHYDGGEHPFRQAFIKRARAADQVTSSTASPELTRTAYYNEILRHLDAHHVMYAVIRDQGHALGQLSLYRPRQSPAFSAEDRSAIKDIAHYVAHAVNRPKAVTANVEFVDADSEGMVVVDFHGQIVEAAAKSLNLLSMALKREFNPASPPLVVGEAAQGAVQQLLVLLQKAILGVAAAAPRLAIDGQWGRFMLSAYALDGDGAAPASRAAIHVRRQQPMILKLAEAMGGFDISPQQREVALLLAQGRSNQQIAEALNVSGNTVNYHIKQLFMRLDAHDRADAVAKMMAGA
ncbi:MAG: LuxR C-terminal-related transcriptional regulator [Burkholderiales bacterium]|nr:LuxR C-terminal-related transcriptional regulator [Burkholderiales bacterium]